jgi:large subunit ribosomal protein L22
MTGPKTNEGATAVGERIGTRARVRYVRSSAYKAREVLNVIRGMDVRTADETLQLVERDIAIVIRKGLASAVANAVNNENQIADELYVSACFADEGPTLKRFRPRARGRAFRIRKRTCHITILVSRMPERQLEQRRTAEAARPAATRGRRGAASQAAARRERVSRSQAALAERRGETDSTESTEPQGLVDTEVVGAVEVTEVPEAPYGEGSHAALDDDGQPEGFPIKGNADSMLYHTPGSPFYGRTKAEVWFATAEAAEAAGFQLPPSLREDADADAADAESGEKDGDK